MTELNIEYAPESENSEQDVWHDRIVEYLRKYLSQPFDRGDPSAVDFSLGDLTTDATWRDLDLSSIVPEDAIAVMLRVNVLDADGVSSAIQFRKKGNSNSISAPTVRTIVANVYNDAQPLVFCNTSRVIQYYADDVTWTAITIAVTGWFK
jgi:hypothetical protein